MRLQYVGSEKQDILLLHMEHITCMSRNIVI